MKRKSWAKTPEEKFLSKVTNGNKKDCWIWPGCKNADGYGALTNYPKNGTIGAHRVSFRIYIGNIPKGMNVLHKCDNPPCVNPEHLFIGTQAENNKDRMRKGRNGNIRGDKNVAAKLSWKKVSVIRSSKLRTCDLAKKYNVSWTTIAYVRLNKTWRVK